MKVLVTVVISVTVSLKAGVTGVSLSDRVIAEGGEFIFKCLYLFVYLAAQGLSCGIQDL